MGELIWVFGGKTSSNIRSNAVYTLTVSKGTATKTSVFGSGPSFKFTSTFRYMNWRKITNLEGMMKNR